MARRAPYFANLFAGAAVTAIRRGMAVSGNANHEDTNGNKTHEVSLYKER